MILRRPIRHACSARSSVPINDHTVNACSPWRFSAPLSPHMAARREGRSIALNEVVDFCRQPGEARLRLIEGVGGVLVPINDRETTADWMAALGVPVILVVGTYLGAISHALTAFESLRGRGITVQGVVVNESLGTTCANRRNARNDCPILRAGAGGVPAASRHFTIAARSAATDTRSRLTDLPPEAGCSGR